MDSWIRRETRGRSVGPLYKHVRGLIVVFEKASENGDHAKQRQDGIGMKGSLSSLTTTFPMVPERRGRRASLTATDRSGGW